LCGNGNNTSNVSGDWWTEHSPATPACQTMSKPTCPQCTTSLPMRKLP
jgi:hypothetical protein